MSQLCQNIIQHMITSCFDLYVIAAFLLKNKFSNYVR